MPGVQLKSLQYFERKGQPKEWTLDGLSLGPINLIVGQNATGKTRTLNLIWNLAKSLNPETKAKTENGCYDVLFDDDGKELRYILQVEDGKVTREQVIAAGITRLSRGDGIEGIIFAERENKDIRFEPPGNEIAATLRQDLVQHKFLEPLYQWARAVRHYGFGGTLGKDRIAIFVKDGPPADERDANQVVPILRKALKEFDQEFIKSLISDMAELHYQIESVEVAAPENIKLLGFPSLPGGGELGALGVRERGINAVFNQTELSDGMFSALSLLIQVTYSQMANRANCILIDDIGEGLDFERSSRLIEILRRKAQQSSFQLIMTTNDQFVMNHVPLKEWSVLQRDGCHVRVRNYENSRKEFEHFRFVGLSNFAFLEMDFVNGPPPEEEAVANG